VSNFPFGAYRRRIKLLITADDVVDAGLEDDFHYFTVKLRHDGEKVIEMQGGARRWPWSTCPDAAGPLHSLEGMPLSDRCLAAGDHADPRLNCTHMFDLAGLAVAHAARGGPIETLRQYDVTIPYAAQFGGRHDVKVWRDGELLHEWTLEGRDCIDPPPFSEVQWRGGFLKWADRTFEPEESEPIIVLRRACDIGMGRGMDLDGYETAEDLAPLMRGICYTQQPEQIPVAIRNKNSAKDYDSNPDDLLASWP
jgi:hypothetical protein